MPLKDLNSAGAVLSAIAEYDRLGGREFLATHGFGQAVRYWLVHEGRRYDSKAIAGVAHGYQFPERGALRAEDFSGGESGAAAQLRGIGFDVVAESAVTEPDAAEWTLGYGETIKRSVLHDVYGGSRQDGVSPSARTPNVFIFSDPSSGEQHGYVDRWGEDDVFYYTGRGQRGHQTFTSGNRAILDHQKNGKALRVFEGAGGTITYAGRFTLDDAKPYDYREAPETGGGPLRKVIVFHLVKMLDDVSSPSEAAPASLASRAGQKYRFEDEDVEVSAPSAPNIDPDAVGRGLNTHRKLQNALAAALAEYGASALSPTPATPAFDIAWHDEDRMVVAEVKSLTDANEVRQLRSGLGQVLDYADMLKEAGHIVQPVLYVERSPKSARWLRLCARHGVVLAWPDRLAELTSGDLFHCSVPDGGDAVP